ncbi:hypothetical protein [Dehalobacterium formicoaceticum]|uniref:hypothetical protein n=1 Tax=Dehalobacterium formicoaceticum TaxID=51515 RepID=UPI000B801672|nr:hypothetical protein [Dehalobacterium formicoaceticum]
MEEIKVSISQEENHDQVITQDQNQDQNLEGAIRETIKNYFSLKDEQIQIQMMSEDERREDHE